VASFRQKKSKKRNVLYGGEIFVEPKNSEEEASSLEDDVKKRCIRKRL